MSDADTLFQEVIQYDSDICNNCFRRTGHTVDQRYFVTTYDGDVWMKYVDRGERSWTHRGNTEHQAGDELVDGTHRGCVCGMNGESLRPAPKDRADRLIERVADRLDEKDVDYDRDAFVAHARDKMRTPKWQGKQDGAIATALEESRQTAHQD